MPWLDLRAELAEEFALQQQFDKHLLDPSEQTGFHWIQRAAERAPGKSRAERVREWREKNRDRWLELCRANARRYRAKRFWDASLRRYVDEPIAPRPPQVPSLAERRAADERRRAHRKAREDANRETIRAQTRERMRRLNERKRIARLMLQRKEAA